MGKECFTCSHKRREEVSGIGQYHCALDGKSINQTDKACVKYAGSKVMEGLRRDLATVARKLRKEL